jgi:hypothetical protein
VFDNRRRYLQLQKLRNQAASEPAYTAVCGGINNNKEFTVVAPRRVEHNMPLIDKLAILFFYKARGAHMLS